MEKKKSNEASVELPDEALEAAAGGVQAGSLAKGGRGEFLVAGSGSAAKRRERSGRGGAKNERREEQADSGYDSGLWP